MKQFMPNSHEVYEDRGPTPERDLVKHSLEEFPGACGATRVVSADGGSSTLHAPLTAAQLQAIRQMPARELDESVRGLAVENDLESRAAYESMELWATSELGMRPLPITDLGR